MKPPTDHLASRPGVAIVCNSLPPYRVHLHRRIAQEMPEIHLWTVCTHEGTDSRWGFDPPKELNTVSFGLVAGVPDLPGLNWTSFRKGGEIIDWIGRNGVRAIVMFGYN